MTDYYADPVRNRLAAAAQAEKVGPHGYEHGWRYVGVPTPKEPGSELHGQLVAGVRADGGHVKGTYDAQNHTVTDIMGHQHPVTSVKPHQAEDWRSAIMNYDQDVQSGRIRFGPSGFADQYPGQASAHAGLMQHAQQHLPGYAISGPETPAKSAHEHPMHSDSVIDRLNKALAAELVKVGPEGYVHGWIKVGQGDVALHNRKAEGLTTEGNKVRGTYDAPSHSVIDKAGSRHTVSHVRDQASSDLERQQNERVYAATRERMQAEAAETRRQQQIWANRPDKRTVSP